MPETRRRTKTNEMAKRLTPEEIEVVQQKMAADQARLHAESESLARQRAEFENEMENSRRELRLEREELDERVREFKGYSDGNKDGKTSNVSDLDHTRHTFFQTPVPAVAPPYAYPPATGPDSDFGLGPKVSYREATEGVPLFDGYNPPLAQFARACRRALEIIPPAAERNLTRILINKLRGHAIWAVEDEPCNSVAQLIDLLTEAFGSHRTIDQYRGELASVYMRPREHVLSFIGRVKNLRTAILDTERQAKGRLDPRFVSDIDNLTIRSFCEGLPLEYRTFIKPDTYGQPSEAFADAKIAAKRLEIERERQRAHAGRREYPVNPIGGPLAHSTPQRPSPSPDPHREQRRNDNRYEEPRRYGPTANCSRTGDERRYPRAPENSGSPRSTATRQPERVNERGHNMGPQQRSKFCRYCKNSGHEIDECRKRQYNNSLRAEQGNARQPSGTIGANRRTQPQNTRPVNPIATEEMHESESESQS